MSATNSTSVATVRIGVVAFSDEREIIHGPDLQNNLDYLAKIKRVIDAAGKPSGYQQAAVSVVLEPVVVHTMGEAVASAKQMRAADVAGVLMVHTMWTFAREAAIFARVFGGHVAGHTNQDPTRPALVGLLCAAGTIDKMGLYHPRIIGDVERPEIQAQILSWARAAGTAHKLVGETYCNFGGRSMGMGTAVRDANDWIRRYGVDVEQIDQLMVLEEAKRVPDAIVEDAYQWLIGQVGWVDPSVPPMKIKNQIRLHEGTKTICKAHDIDFYGIKCQPELSEGTDFAVPCLNQAFSNATFDWSGPKAPVVCACEADMGAAMTMRLLQGISGQPALFMDFRDYSAKHNDFIFCNCGSQSVNYARDMKDIHLVHTDKYYPSGGVHVQYVADDGEVTLARLAEDKDGEWLAVIPGQFRYYERERCEETTTLWPHAYLETSANPADVLATYGSNHGHAVRGNWVPELEHLGKMLGLRVRVFGQ